MRVRFHMQVRGNYGLFCFSPREVDNAMPLCLVKFRTLARGDLRLGFISLLAILGNISITAHDMNSMWSRVGRPGSIRQA